MSEHALIAALATDFARLERSRRLYALFFPAERLGIHKPAGQPSRVVVLAEDEEP